MVFVDGVPRRSMTALERGDHEGCIMSELKIEIRKGNQVLHVIKVADPRIAISDRFNADAEFALQGIRAYPVWSETRRARSKRREA